MRKACCCSIDAANSIQLNGLTLADLPQMRMLFSPFIGTAGDDTLEGAQRGRVHQRLRR